MSETIVKHPCQTCGCSPDVHAFDDYRLVEFEGVPWEQRPFRCLGPEHRGCPTECGAFIGNAVTILETV